MCEGVYWLPILGMGIVTQKPTVNVYTALSQIMHVIGYSIATQVSTIQFGYSIATLILQ